MVPKDYTALSLRRDIYEDFKAYYEKHKESFKRKGINSFTSFIQMCVYHYMETFENP